MFCEPKIKIMAIYEKSAGMLVIDLVKEQGIQKGEIFEKDRIYSWFKQKYPKIKQGTISAYINLLSTNAPSRIHHSPHQNGKDDLFYQIDSKRLRLYDSTSDPNPIYIRDTTRLQRVVSCFEFATHFIKSNNRNTLE